MATQDVTIDIAGRNFDGFTQAAVNRSMETLSNTFTITAVSSQNVPFPIKMGSACVIRVLGKPVITGFVEKIDVKYDGGSHEITISGRDRTCDVVDSTLGANIVMSNPFTLKQLISKVLDILGIDNIDIIDKTEVLPLSSTVQFKENVGAIDFGASAFDFLEKYAKKRQVLLTTDGAGNIVITRSATKIINTALTLNQNTQALITEGNVSYDNSKRFHLYHAKSQSSQSSPFSSDKTVTPQQSTNTNSQANDNDIRKTRTYYFKPDNASSQEEINDGVKWEANFRRSQSLKYKVTVPYFQPLEDKGTIWEPNTLINVNDE
jgi:prophage tail gpP-like protein